MDNKIEDTDHRTRPRSSTNSFTPFAWRRPPPIPASPTPITPLKTLSIEGLIEGLTPPSVPSLSLARSLSALLPSASPCPSLHLLTPILASLCANDSPHTLQAAGFEILAAYCSNQAWPSFSPADVLACFSVFMSPWSLDMWEYRFRAFVALCDAAASQKETFDRDVLRLIKYWIKSAFDPLLVAQSLSDPESAERQRSLDDYFSFFVSIFQNSDSIISLFEEEIVENLKFLGDMVDAVLLLAADHNRISLISADPLQSPDQQSPRRLLHRRNRSSASITTLTSPVAIRHPADVVLNAYVLFLSSQQMHLSYVHLNSIMPLLFRALAFYASPLPRLSLSPLPEYHSRVENQISTFLDSLFGGFHSVSCSIVLKRSLFPVFSDDFGPLSSIQLSIGAYRVLHNFMRRSLLTRLARAYIAKSSTSSYTQSGAPGQIDLPSDIIQFAWPKEDLTSWELSKVSRALCKSIAEWVQWQPDDATAQFASMRDLILIEAAGILNDVLQALDDKNKEDELDEEELTMVGRILSELVSYIRLRRNSDGSPFIIPRTRPLDVSDPLLRMLSFMLSRDPELSINSFIPNVLLSVTDHLSDFDTSQAINAMAKRHSFSPTCPQWLDNWASVLSCHHLYSPSKPETKDAIMDALHDVYSSIKDIPPFRMSLVQLFFHQWKQRGISENWSDETHVIWSILGEEIIFRLTESVGELSIDNRNFIETVIVFLTNTAFSTGLNDEDKILSDAQPMVVPSTPAPTRMQRDRETAMSSPTQEDDDVPLEHLPSSVGAVTSLVLIFSRLVFTSHAVADSNLLFSLRVYDILIGILAGSPCPKARLTVLQFLMRLRAERDHKIYYASDDYDRDGHVMSLAALINRLQLTSRQSLDGREEWLDEDREYRRSRGRVSDRSGRGLSRGRGGGGAQLPPRSTSGTPGRSRSGVPGSASTATLWFIPESPPFVLPFVDCVSQALTSYDPANPDQQVILPLSSYLNALIDILEGTGDWEILSYILCNLPVQLANKHLFCGPKCRNLMNRLLKVVCGSILQGQFAMNIQHWPEGLKIRDAQGLAYHTLSVLVSYKPCFDGQLLHALVEVLLHGLSGQPSTVKCCLHALSLSAIELQPSMRKYLPKILEKLSQIMSNPAMAVHIIDFLSIVGAIPSLHANFTDADYKMVFGVALQYLQQHNRPDSPPAISWALSQHVRVMAYYIVYVWFLAIRLSDRHRHIPFISRQLLLANEGKDKVDQPTEVCFDWLARYTYASADPRPANSFLNEIVTNPRHPVESAVSEKTWIVGNSVVTIRALTRLGWIEVISRRASGQTKFLCRVENVPVIGPGDVNPDMLMLPASLMIDRRGKSTMTESTDSELSVAKSFSTRDFDPGQKEPRPDPITGYVWGSSAPSQRRKDVMLDPAFFALQLSAFPESRFPSKSALRVRDASKLKSFVQNLDRMPVIDTHKVGIMYVAPGQQHESEILRNTHGSPAYTRFLEGIGRLINLRGQVDVYAGGLNPDEDGEYAYAWWDDNSQILYHTATLMPTNADDELCNNKKRHIGNDYIRIIWNDSGSSYRFDTLATQFQFVNIVIEPHSRGAVAAFSDNVHENEYFKVTVQYRKGMTPFTPIGDFKLISANNLSVLVRQLSLLSDWFASIFDATKHDTEKIEVTTNWRARLDTIQRFRAKVSHVPSTTPVEDSDIIHQHGFRDFSAFY